MFKILVRRGVVKRLTVEREGLLGFQSRGATSTDRQ